ncbi:uncharacterized protein G2W53_012929 [Senna tora]|uniref:Uncharacterized protein n=1 Tax=Senna tora TaxID=362788 RepID=A0A834U182_9FABA|nr:uncharacterized protein G2W53_012929 [Senna tora]
MEPHAPKPLQIEHLYSTCKNDRLEDEDKIRVQPSPLICACLHHVI